MFNTIEYSRSAEAMATFSTIRAAMERCYLMNNGTYLPCASGGSDWSALDIENPSSAPNAHFQYTRHPLPYNTLQYYIIARRTTLDGGNTEDMIYYVYYPDYCTKDITIYVPTGGTQVFKPLDTYSTQCY